jgi:hypothetical protein
MSGRKQHYIPQFVLREFGQDGRGKYKQVRVFRLDGNFLSGTEGIAAEREFYSALNENQETLDDLITKAEPEYVQIHRSLIDTSNGDKVDAKRVARLVCHLSVRGNSMRDAISEGSSNAVEAAKKAFSDPEILRQMLGLSGAEPTGRIRVKIDELYNENKSKIQRKGTSRHQFRELCFRRLNQDWATNFATLPAAILGLFERIDFDAMSATAHNDVLSENLEPERRVEALARLHWKIFETDSVLILPDCIAIADDAKEGLVPVGFSGNDSLQGVLYPLMPNRILCGGTYANVSALNEFLPEFQIAAAYNSWDFFVASPSTDIDPRNQILIGGRIRKSIESAVGEALQEALLEGLRP